MAPWPTTARAVATHHLHSQYALALALMSLGLLVGAGWFYFQVMSMRSPQALLGAVGVTGLFVGAALAHIFAAFSRCRQVELQAEVSLQLATASFYDIPTQHPMWFDNAGGFLSHRLLQRAARARQARAAPQLDTIEALTETPPMGWLGELVTSLGGWLWRLIVAVDARCTNYCPAGAAY